MSDRLQKQELDLSIRQLEKELFVLFCISLYFCQQIYLNKLDESLNLIKQIREPFKNYLADFFR